PWCSRGQPGSRPGRCITVGLRIQIRGPGLRQVVQDYSAVCLPGPGAETVVGGGAEHTLVPGLQERFVYMHGWFPSPGLMPAATGALTATPASPAAATALGMALCMGWFLSGGR